MHVINIHIYREMRNQDPSGIYQIEQFITDRQCFIGGINDTKEFNVKTASIKTPLAKLEVHFIYKSMLPKAYF